MKPKPYAKEVKALKLLLKKEIQASATVFENRRYACVLTVSRENPAWDGFHGEVRQRRRRLYLGRDSRDSSNNYYEQWTIFFTQDRTLAMLFEPEEAIHWNQNLPFETTIEWTFDNRTRCATCGTPTEFKESPDDKRKTNPGDGIAAIFFGYAHFCPNNKCKKYGLAVPTASQL